MKAAIAKRTQEHDWPDKQFVNKCHTHDIGNLIQLADLKTALDNEADGNADFAQNWSEVIEWNEQCRYERHSEARAQRMIDAVVNNQNGVLPWIKANW